MPFAASSAALTITGAADPAAIRGRVEPTLYLLGARVLGIGPAFTGQP